jgi:uncharacterized membrane protein YphA (DoxX/SURF4 family)
MTTILFRTADTLHRHVRQWRWLYAFAWLNRILLAIAFMPSGWTKLVGNRFTLVLVETPIGYFFEALYQSGWYYNFIGFAQLLVAALLLMPRTTTLGAVLYFPIILNIFIITISLNFRGTWMITGLMLLANLFLLCWDYPKWKGILQGESRQTPQP